MRDNPETRANPTFTKTLLRWKECQEQFYLVVFTKGLEYVLQEAQLSQLGHYDQLELNRDECVEALTILARFAEQAATGKYFILHLEV